MSTIFEVAEELRNGGEWLGAARAWMQSNVPRGDVMTWGSGELVQIPFCKLEDLALRVAVAAVAADRAKQAASQKRPAHSCDIPGCAVCDYTAGL